VDRIGGGFVGGRRRDCVWVWVVGEEEGRGGLDLAGVVVVVNHPCPEEAEGGFVCAEERGMRTPRTGGGVRMMLVNRDYLPSKGSALVQMYRDEAAIL
jgi:hypothetical protein